MSRREKKDLYRSYQTKDALSFLDASLVKRIEPLLMLLGPAVAQRARPDCIGLLDFVELVWNLAVQHSDVLKGEEKSYVESLCKLFQEVATQNMQEGCLLEFAELPWSKVTDHFISEKIRITAKEGGDQGDSGGGAAGGGTGNNDAQREAPRFNVGRIADYSTHKGGICALQGWHRWGLILSSDRDYPGVKVYDPYVSTVGPPIYCGDLPFFPYNMSGGSLIRRSDVSLSDYIQNMCTPPTAGDVKKGSKLKHERIMVPLTQVIMPPKGAFPLSIAVDDKNDVIGVIFSSRHLCFWTTQDGGLRLNAVYPVANAFTGLWYLDGGLGEWCGAFDDFNLGLYSREQLRLSYGLPMSFALVPANKAASGQHKLVAPVAVLRGHMDQVVQVIPIPDVYMASASYDNNVLLWERTTGAQLKRISTGVGLRGMAFNPVMDLLLTVGFGTEASLYHLGNLGDGSSASSIKRAGVLRGHISGLTCCCFMGSSIAVTCDDVGYIRLWDLRNNFQCFQLIQNETVASSICCVYRLEDGFQKIGHLGRSTKETVEGMIASQEEADFVIGGERLLKMRKIGQAASAGNIPQVVFADFCYLNHSLVVVTEQYVYSFHTETGAQLECVPASQIFAMAEALVPEKDRDQGEISLESIQGVQGLPGTASQSSSAGAGASPKAGAKGGASSASQLGKMKLSLGEEDAASQRSDSRDGNDSRHQTSVERAFTSGIKKKRIHRKKELQKLALEKKYGIGFDKKPPKSPVSAFDDLFAQGSPADSTMMGSTSSSKMSKTHTGSFFKPGQGKKGKHATPGAASSPLSPAKAAGLSLGGGIHDSPGGSGQDSDGYGSDPEPIAAFNDMNEHLLEDNQQIRKNNRGMETISSACFDGAHSRLILGSDRGKIVIVDNKNFQPICARLRNTHDAGKSVTHIVYIPQTTSNIGHYRYYDYAVHKREFMSQISEKLQDPKFESFLPDVEHHLKQPLSLPEAVIASGGSDGTIILCEDNPSRGYPLLMRLTYSSDSCRLKNLYFDFELGYLVSVTDTHIKFFEPHLDQGDPARVLKVVNNVREREKQMAAVVNPMDAAARASEDSVQRDLMANAGIVIGGSSSGAASADADPHNDGGDDAKSEASARTRARHETNVPRDKHPGDVEMVPNSATVRWRRYGNNLGFSVDAHTGEVLVMNMERGEIDAQFLHQKTLIHKDEVKEVNFRATCLALVEWDIKKIEWANPAKKDGIVNFSTRPPAQTPPSTAERDASRIHKASTTELLSYPDPATSSTSTPSDLSEFPYFKDFAKVAEQAWGRSARCDTADGVELRRTEMERQNAWLPQVRQLRQRNLYDKAEKKKEEALKQNERASSAAAPTAVAAAAAEGVDITAGENAAGKNEMQIITSSKNLEHSKFLFDRQTFFLTQDPSHEEEIRNMASSSAARGPSGGAGAKAKDRNSQASASELAERFLTVLYDLPNRSDIELQAASELSADFGYLQDLELASLKQYFSDPRLFEEWSFILGKLDETFWGPDGNPIDDTSDQLVSTTGKLKKSLMGKSALPVDAQEEAEAADEKNQKNQTGPPKTKKRVKDPRDLFERRQKYRERARDLFKGQPGVPSSGVNYETKDQSCILCLGNEKGEISLVRIRPERVSARAAARMFSQQASSMAAVDELHHGQTPDLETAFGAAPGIPYGQKQLVIHRETVCTWKAHESKVAMLKLIPGVQALISCGETGDVKIWPLDTYFGSDGRDPENELTGVDHSFVQKSLEDRQKLIISDTVFYKKPWVSLTLGPETISKTHAFYLPRVLRQSLLFAYQGYRVMTKLRTNAAIEDEENSLYFQTSIMLYDRYFGKLMAAQELLNEHKRREAEILKEKSKGISLVEVKSYTVSQVKAAPEPDSLRPLTIFKELTQASEKPWVSNWVPRRKILDDAVGITTAPAAVKPTRRGSMLGGGKKKKQIKPSEVPFPERLTKAANEWNFERLYGKGGQGFPAKGEKALRRTFSDTRQLSWNNAYEEFAPDHLKRGSKAEEPVRRRKRQSADQGGSDHLPAEERMKLLQETIAEPVLRPTKDPNVAILRTKKWETFLTKEKESLPVSPNIDWLRQTMPALYRADRTFGAASPERLFPKDSSPEKARFLHELEENKTTLKRREGTKPSLDTQSKFRPEVNMGRDYAVSGGDVMLRAGEGARRRAANMQQMLLRQYPRRSPEEEQKLMDIASKAGEVKTL